MATTTQQQPAAPPPTGGAATGTVLEEKKRLSESVIWKLQRAFYASRGPAAWKPHGVPFYITSNPYIAGAYVQTTVGFVRDALSGGAGPEGRIDPAQPIHIVELAAGSGQFAFLFLRKLAKLQAALPWLAGLRFRYVMTDFAESNLAAWQAKERFRPLVESGRLDFARFDLERDTQAKLVVSGESLAPGSLANPLIVIANYTFDTTVQDAFAIKDGTLHESLVTSVSSQVEPKPDDPAVLGRLSVKYERQPAKADYYEDPAFNRILARYAASLSDTAFAFPTGALVCVRAVREWSGGRMLLLSGDKAYCHADEVIRRNDPSLAHHGGSFSLMVNFHALGLYLAETGGFALHSASRDGRLKVSAFVSGFPDAAFPELREAYRAHVDDFGPADYFGFAVNLTKECPAPTIETLLSIFRLGEWDFELLVAYREPLLKQLGTASENARNEVRLGLERAWDGFYPLQRDVAFEFSRIALALKQPQDAVRYCQESLRLFGDHYLTFLTLAYAESLRGRNQEALAAINRSLELKPETGPARELKIQLEGKLAR